MESKYILETERLLLRPFNLDDAATVQRLAGRHEIADTTDNVPHPYEDGMAEEWIATHAEERESGTGYPFAITLKAPTEQYSISESGTTPKNDTIVGAISLFVTQEHNRAEIGYWVGVPYWNRGFCTEAAQRVLDFGFVDLRFNKICAHHLTRNPASGRVLQKVGMRHEGSFSQYVYKANVYEDVEFYGVTYTEYKQR